MAIHNCPAAGIHRSDEMYIAFRALITVAPGCGAIDRQLTASALPCQGRGVCAKYGNSFHAWRRASTLAFGVGREYTVCRRPWRNDVPDPATAALAGIEYRPPAGGGDIPPVVLRATNEPPGATPHFETAEHAATVARSIAAGVLPLKFAYTGSAAHTHDAYARSQPYERLMMATMHWTDMIRRLRLPLGVTRQVVEVGPGNGTRSASFLRALAAAGRPCTRYLGVDFSATMLRLARAEVARRTGGRSAVHSLVWDVERAHCRDLERWRTMDGPLLAVLIGHTLGNVECVPTTLANLRASLRPGDVLLVEVVVQRLAAERLDPLLPYRSALFRAAALEPIRAAGISTAAVDLELTFVRGAVRGEAVLTRPQRAGTVSLPAGHRLRCFRSQRFVPDAIPSLLRGSGWTIIDALPDENGDHLVVAAQRS